MPTRLIERNGRGDVTSLLPLLPDRTTCLRHPGSRQKIYRTWVGESAAYFDAYDILHVRGICFDHDKDACRMVRYMRHAIAKVVAREKFASSFYRRGGRLGGILQIPFSKDKRAKSNIESGFRRTYESINAAFKTIVLRENATFHAAQGSFRDTQMIESEKRDVKTVANWLNIPPHKLGDDSKSAHNSLEQENRSYIDSSLGTHLCAIAGECRLKLTSRQARRRRTHFFMHTVDSLLWTDAKTRAEIASNGVINGWMTINEGRRMNSLADRDDGDRLLNPPGAMDPKVGTPEVPNENSEQSLSSSD